MILQNEAYKSITSQFRNLDHRQGFSIGGHRGLRTWHGGNNTPLIFLPRSALTGLVFRRLEVRVTFCNWRTFDGAPPPGNKGSDYDLDLVPSPEIALCCELKCRLEASEGSAKMILTLRLQ